MQARDIFLTALEIVDPAERAAALDEACGGNAELRAEVEELLEAHDAASRFLESPAEVADSTATPTILSDASDPQSKPSAGRTSGEAEFRSFLQPPTRSGWLGRLAHYEIEEILGRGAFGIVAKAFDEKLHRVVAIKLMSPELATTSPPRKRFLREARAAAAVTHENIVAIHAVEEEPIPYLVMEFVPGRTLQQRMDEHGPLEVPEILRTGQQVAAGLAAAHEAQLIHRDIKPSNILLSDGPAERAKISDFGLARAVDDASLTSSGLIAGTPMYMAPEQARGEILDHRADLFSLGSVLYQMASGRPPFRAASTVAVLKRVCDDTPRSLKDVIPGIPGWLQTIIFRLLEKDRTSRYQTAREVAELLARCQSELEHEGQVTCVTEEPGTAATRVWQPNDQPGHPSRNRLTRWLAGGVIAAAAAGLVLAVVSGGFSIPASWYRTQPLRDAQAQSPPGPDESPGDHAGAGQRVDRGSLSLQRDAALAVLNVGGSVSGMAAGKHWFEATTPSELPAGPISLQGIRLDGIQKPLGEVCRKLGQLPGIELLFAAESALTDADLRHLKSLDPREVGLQWTQITDQSAETISHWKRLRGISLGGTRTGDVMCRALAQISAITEIRLSGQPDPYLVTDQGLAELSQCSRLVVLALDGCKAITPSGISQLQSLSSLRWLLLADTEVGDDVVDVLRTMTQLRMVRLWTAILRKNTISEEAALRLAGELPQTWIDHPATSTVAGEQGIVQWARKYRPLKMKDAYGADLREHPNPLPLHELAFDTGATGSPLPIAGDAIPLQQARCLARLTWPQLNDAGRVLESIGDNTAIFWMLRLPDSDLAGDGLRHLASLSALGQLLLEDCSLLDDDALTHLPSMPGLWSLRLSGCPIRGRGLQSLSQAPYLQLLDLANTRLTPESLHHLSSLTQLRWLDLSGTPLHDAAVPYLSRLTGLQRLDIGGTGLTADGIARLHAAIPRCAVRWDGGLVVAENRPVQVAASWHGWPADAPRPAIAPFDANQANAHQAAWAKYLKVPVEYENSLGMTFRLIPPGEFLMGSTPEEIEQIIASHKLEPIHQLKVRSEAPQRQVTLTQPYYLSACEISQQEFEQITGQNPSAWSSSGRWAAQVQGMDTTLFPVESVTWIAAVRFCNGLGNQEGLESLYDDRLGVVATTSRQSGYRLPTEAEWEFACRAGTHTRYWTGDRTIDMVKAEWRGPNSKDRPHPVGQRLANPFGMHDMHGNIREWCQDAGPADKSQRSSLPATDPVAPFPQVSSPAIQRGGDFRGNNDWDARSAVRRWADRYREFAGFRVRLSVEAVKQLLTADMPQPSAPKPAIWHGWPADAPPPAIAPFNAEQAKAHQGAWAKYLKVPVEYENSLGMKFRLIPPGEFLMGSTPEEIEAAQKVAGAGNRMWREWIQSEGPQHRVVLTQPVYVSGTEVTQSQYEQVTGNNPSHFSATGAGRETVAELETGNHPVEMVSWIDAAEFCAKLSVREKLKPFYFRAGETVTPLEGTGYRLPTEAEWEFACRAGTTTRFWSGDEDNDLIQAGWFGSNSGNRTHSSGELKANPFGLSDVHGNVREWVQDSLEPDFYAASSNGPAIDPSAPVSTDFWRSVRGGGWGSSFMNCRSSNRNGGTQTDRQHRIGFRVVLPVEAIQ